MNKLGTIITVVSFVLLFLAGVGPADSRENYRSFYYRQEVRSMPIQEIVSSKETCIQCHDKVTPRATAEHRAGAHFKAGVSCEACHGTNHSAMMVITGKKVCSKCHQSETREMLSSKHANSWHNSWRNARYEVLPKSMRQQGCARCHDISYGMYEVRDVRCDYCHTSHEFSAEQARNPLSCYTCHMGPDHPQAEAYQASMHGQINSENPDGEKSAPTCVTCHQSNNSHNVSQNIAIGGVSNGGIPDTWGWFKNSQGQPLMKRTVLTAQQFSEAREGAVVICSKCHDGSFSTASLTKADGIKEITERKLAAGQKLVVELDKAGLLYPDPKTRPANPVEGNKLVLGGHQLYNNITKAEAIYFRMFKFAGSGGWKSAYHQDFQGADNEGIRKLTELSRELKDEAEILRTLGSTPVIEVNNRPPDNKIKIKVILFAAGGLLLGSLLAVAARVLGRHGRGTFTGIFFVFIFLNLVIMPGSAFAWDKGQQKQCVSCHEIQGKSLQSGKHSGLKCLDCHKNGEGAAQVRKPETCGKCHIGAKGYQLETYLSSPHGIKYRMKGAGQWIPTCATCHMPKGEHSPVSGSPGNAWQDSKIGKVCLNCHILDEIQKFGKDIDDIYKSTDNLTAGLRQTGLDLIDKGVLIPQEGSTWDVGSVKARWGTETKWELVNLRNLPKHEQELAQRLVDQLVQKTREGIGEASVKTRIGAAHVNPDYTHWYGNAVLNLNIAEVNGTARELEMFAYKAGFRGRQNQISLIYLLVVGFLTSSAGYYITQKYFKRSRD